MKTKMVDLALTEKERKDYSNPKSTINEGPAFSYGTTLDLGKRELDKLGIKLEDLPDVDDEFTLTAKCYVKSVRAERREKDKDSMNIALQITSIQLVEDKTKEREKEDEDRTSKNLSPTK